MCSELPTFDELLALSPEEYKVYMSSLSEEHAQFVIDVILQGSLERDPGGTRDLVWSLLRKWEIAHV